jgi:hypothetical protein
MRSRNPIDRIRKEEEIHKIKVSSFSPNHNSQAPLQRSEIFTHNSAAHTRKSFYRARFAIFIFVPKVRPLKRESFNLLT